MYKDRPREMLKTVCYRGRSICYGPFQLHAPFRPGALNMCAVSTPFLGDKWRARFNTNLNMLNYNM